MQGAKKSPFHGFSKHTPSDARRPVNSSSNPSDSADDNMKTFKISGRTASEPSFFTSNTNPFEEEEIKGSSSSQHNSLAANNRYKNDLGPSSTNPFEYEKINANSSSQHNSLAAKNRCKNDFGMLRTNPFEDEEIKGGSSSQNSHSSTAKYRNKNDFRESGGLEEQSVQELGNYAAYRAEETTQSVKNSLKIAEDIREDATRTLVTLHQQGEQITKTHIIAADMDHDLSRGEKRLGSLGGIFSKTWKPKKTRPITGPVITRDDPVQSKGNHLEQRERLGLTSASKEHSRTPPPEPTNAMQKVENRTFQNQL